MVLAQAGLGGLGRLDLPHDVDFVNALGEVREEIVDVLDVDGVVLGDGRRTR